MIQNKASLLGLALTGVVSLLLVAGPLAASDEMPAEDLLGSVRKLYIAAVDGEEALDRGLAEVRIARVRAGEDARLHTTLRAYEGALITLRAKHGTWPPRRLQHLQEGLSILDEVVKIDPSNAEARYLRLMSCYYLPAILGRRGTVREDFAALATLLPAVRGDYPPSTFNAIATFVLKEGEPNQREAAALRASLFPDA
jgi:hypothetical protein